MAIYLGLDASTQSLTALLIDVTGDRREIVVERRFESAPEGAGHRSQPGPEQSMVNEQEVDPVLDRHADGRNRSVNRRGDPGHFARVFDLQPIQGLWIVVDF